MAIEKWVVNPGETVPNGWMNADWCSVGVTHHVPLCPNPATSSCLSPL